MPKIKVNTSQLATYESDMQGILSRVNSIANQFDSVSRSLDWDIKVEENINTRLLGLKNELSAEARGISGMKEFLGTAIRKYDAVENKNSGKDLKDEATGQNSDYATEPNTNRKIPDNKNPYGLNRGRELWRKDFDFSNYPPEMVEWMKNSNYSSDADPSMGNSETALPDKIWHFLSDFRKGAFSINRNNYLDPEKKDNYSRWKTWSNSTGIKPDKNIYSDSSAISDKIDEYYMSRNNTQNSTQNSTQNDSQNNTQNNSHNGIIPKQEKKAIKQDNPDEKWYSQSATIAEIKAEDKVEVSMQEAKISGESKYAKGSANSKLFTAEAHTSANMGMYVYKKDANGNVSKVLSPAISAEVGASAAVIDVNAEGRVGLGKNNNMLGVYGKTQVKVDSAEIKGKVALNSKEVYAGASAEADLVKINATGGVSALGTDIGVKGALKVGIGAHAEVGWTDDKFKVDIGASMGLGVDLGFEIDFGGTVDAVCDMAESIYNKKKSGGK